MKTEKEIKEENNKISKTINKIMKKIKKPKTLEIRIKKNTRKLLVFFL